MSTALKISAYIISIIFIFQVSGKSIFQENELISLNKLQLDIDATKITVSGFSAGSTMATQMHIAHSSLISGVALFSQAFYRCGPTSLVHFGLGCTTHGDRFNSPRYSVCRSFENAYTYGNKSLIDPLVNIQKHRVYIWTGKNDSLIPQDVAEKNYDFYSEFISNKTQISLTVNDVASHEFPSDSFGTPCGEGAEDTYYIGNCSYSGAYESLKFIIGDEITKPEGQVQLSTLQVFDQTEAFANGLGDANLTNIGMADVGFLYIPQACYENKCLLHFHFHGCAEGVKNENGSISIDRARNYVLNNGFLQMAEANNIVMVFPQTIEMKINNGGCWDFFSFTSNLFATKRGHQIQVIHGMMYRLINGGKVQATTLSGSISKCTATWYTYLFQSFTLLITVYYSSIHSSP